MAYVENSVGTERFEKLEILGRCNGDDFVACEVGELDGE